MAFFRRRSSQERTMPTDVSDGGALALLQKSELFDASWYLSRYPEVAAAGVDPVQHYVVHGAREGRMPNALFDSAFYLGTYTDVAQSGTNPLAHFIVRGANEGRDPNPLFDTAWYAERYLDGDLRGTNPLAHHLAVCRDLLWTDTSPAFHSQWYALTYQNGGDPHEPPLAHYLRVGRDAGLLPNDIGLPDPGRRSYKLRGTGLFDPSYYAHTYPDVRTSGLDPFTHYTTFGCKEGRTPNALFDVNHYIGQAPECAGGALDPLLHYLEGGAAAGLNPNLFFDTAWYLAHYPDCTAAACNPLAHFIADGGRTTHPSPRFDAAWYLEQYADVAREGFNPLAHYLTTGMDEGRITRALPRQGMADPTEAHLVALKDAPKRNAWTVLLVTHAPDGKLKRHVPALVDGYCDAGAEVVLIIAADQRRTAVPQYVVDRCAAVHLRANGGFDFAAWAHVIRCDDALLGCRLLVLANDSLIGPLDPDGLVRLFARAEASTADIVGLTENTYIARHLQSFFLALKPACLSSAAFIRFINGIVELETKQDVIAAYELTFSALMRAEGLATEALFPAGTRSESDAEAMRDRTIFDWSDLIEEGFPFVKASLVSGQHEVFGGMAVRLKVAELGIDLDAPTLGPVIWTDLRGGAEPRPRSPLRVAFLGPTNVANGLGMAARGYVKALQRTGWDINVHPLQVPFHVHAQIAPDWQACSFSGPADVALVHVNGDSWEALLNAEQLAIATRARQKVGLFVWETATVPREWLPTIDDLDAIWAPTTFVAEIFRAVTPNPVKVVPYVVENDITELPGLEASATICAAFGLDAARSHILYAFDGSSFLARKNPHALIRAFRASGLGRAGWQLVLKTKHVFDLPLEGAQLLELVETAGDVVVIDRPMSQRDLASLFSLCPVYASSHASEGFGLTIAEAMEMGKVVVATDYGGSRDFLDESCGFPVPAKEVRLTQSFGPYRRGSSWGQIDERALAEALRGAAAAVEDGSARDIGRAATARIRETLSSSAVARAMRAAIGQFPEWQP